jgi:hypothetical protein
VALPAPTTIAGAVVAVVDGAPAAVVVRVK